MPPAAGLQQGLVPASKRRAPLGRVFSLLFVACLFARDSTVAHHMLTLRVAVLAMTPIIASTLAMTPSGAPVVHCSTAARARQHSWRRRTPGLGCAAARAGVFFASQSLPRRRRAAPPCWTHGPYDNLEAVRGSDTAGTAAPRPGGPRLRPIPRGQGLHCSPAPGIGHDSISAKKKGTKLHYKSPTAE